MGPALAALGDDLGELAALLEPWAEAVMDAGGYPPSPLAITRSSSQGRDHPRRLAGASRRARPVACWEHPRQWVPLTGA